MNRFLAGVLASVLLLVAVTLLASDRDGQRAQAWETVRLSIDAPNAIVLERDAQAYALELARIEAEQAAALAQERTLRLYGVLAALTLVALSVAMGLLITRQRPPVVIVRQLPDGTRQYIDEGAVEVMPFVRGQLVEKR